MYHPIIYLVLHVLLLFFKPTGYQTVNITSQITPTTTTISNWPKLDISSFGEAIQ